MMRCVRLMSALLVLYAVPSFAQGWSEYINMDERFGVNFPADPTITNGTYELESGRTVPTRIFTVTDGPNSYSITVIKYAGVNDDLAQGLLAHVSETIRSRGGETTYDGVAVYEGMDTQMIQITNPDQTRSFIAATQPPETSGLDRIYIVEGRTPANATPPGLFQQSLSIRDLDGERMRYSTDIEGTKFRVFPGGGGAPLLRQMCAAGLPCADPNAPDYRSRAANP